MSDVHTRLKIARELAGYASAAEAARALDVVEASYFAQRGIYTSTSTELLIKALPPGEDHETHRATVVLLDSQGTRFGESAWHVDFRVPEQEETS